MAPGAPYVAYPCTVRGEPARRGDAESARSHVLADSGATSDDCGRYPFAAPSGPEAGPKRGDWRPPACAVLARGEAAGA